MSNREVAYMGQLAGIAVEGILETFTPHADSPLNQDWRAWLERLGLIE